MLRLPTRPRRLTNRGVSRPFSWTTIPRPSTPTLVRSESAIRLIFVVVLVKSLMNVLAPSRVLQFYTSTTKQVKDVHEEAVRIASEKKATVGTDQAAHDVAPTFTEKVDQATAQVPVANP